MRSAPQSRLFAAISLINVIVSCESLGLLELALDLCFQNTRKGIVNLMETAELLERKSTQKGGPSPLPSRNVPCFNGQLGGRW